MSHLRVLFEPCQTLGSYNSTVTKRRTALKAILAALGDQTVAKKLGESAISATLSFLTIIDAASSLAEAETRASFRAEAVDGLRQLVELSDRFAPSLLEHRDAATVIDSLARIINTAFKSDTNDDCLPRASHLLCAVLANPRRAPLLSAPMLARMFSIHGSALVAAMSSKDLDEFTQFTINNEPLPACLYKTGARCGAVCVAILRSELVHAQSIFADSVLPVIEAAFQARSGDSLIAPAFSHTAFAEVMGAFARAIRCHHSLISDVSRARLPALIELIRAAWPRQSGKRASLMVKQASVSIIAWALSNQLHTPRDSWLCFTDPATVHSLVSILSAECRREDLFEEDLDHFGSHAHSTLDQRTREFFLTAINLANIAESFKLNQPRGSTLKGERADSDGGTDHEQAAPKRRRLTRVRQSDLESCDQDVTMAPASRSSLSLPLPSPLLALIVSFRAVPPMPIARHLQLITVLHEEPACSTFLFSKGEDKHLTLLALVEHAGRVATKGAAFTRIAAFECLVSIARAFARARIADMLEAAVQSAVSDVLHPIASLAARIVLEDNDRAVGRAALALLTAMIEAQCGHEDLDWRAVTTRIKIVGSSSGASTSAAVKAEPAASTIEPCHNVAFRALEALLQCSSFSRGCSHQRVLLLTTLLGMRPTLSPEAADVPLEAVESCIQAQRSAVTALLLPRSHTQTLQASRAPRSHRICIPVVSLDLDTLDASDLHALESVVQNAPFTDWVSATTTAATSQPDNSAEGAPMDGPLIQLALGCLSERTSEAAERVRTNSASESEPSLLLWLVADVDIVDALLATLSRDPAMRAELLRILAAQVVIIADIFAKHNSKAAVVPLTSVVRVLARRFDSASTWLSGESHSCSHLIDALNQLLRALTHSISRIVDDDAESSAPFLSAARDCAASLLRQGFRLDACDQRRLDDAISSEKQRSLSLIAPSLFLLALNRSLSGDGAAWPTAFTVLAQTLGQAVNEEATAAKRSRTVFVADGESRAVHSSDALCWSHFRCAGFLLQFEALVTAGEITIDEAESEAIRAAVDPLLQRLDALQARPSSSIAPMLTLLQCLTCVSGIDSGMARDWARAAQLFGWIEPRDAIVPLSARMIAARAIVALIDRAADPQRAWCSTRAKVQGFLEQALASETTNRSLVQPLIACLTGCSVKQYYWERDWLASLVSLSASRHEQPDHFLHSLSLTAVTSMASSVSTGIGPSALMEFHIPFILARHFEDPNASLDALPLKLLDIHDETNSSSSAGKLTGFCHRHAASLCTALVASIHHHREDFNRLAAILDQTPAALLAAHWPSIGALAFALRACLPDRKDSASFQCWVFLKSVSTSKQLYTLCDRHRAALITGMLQLHAEEVGTAELAEFSSEGKLIEACQSLVAAITKTSNPAECEPTGAFLTRASLDLATTTILFVKAKLSRANRAHRFHRWLQTARTLIVTILGKHVILVSVARAIVDFVAPLVGHAADQSHAAPRLLAECIGCIARYAHDGRRQGHVNETELSSLATFTLLTIAQWAEASEERRTLGAELAESIRGMLEAQPNVFTQHCEHLALLATHSVLHSQSWCQPSDPPTLVRVFAWFLAFVDLLALQPPTDSIAVAVTQLTRHCAALQAASGSNQDSANRVFACLIALSYSSDSISVRNAVSSAIAELGLVAVDSDEPLRALDIFTAHKPDSCTQTHMRRLFKASALPLAYPPWFARFYKLGDGLPVNSVSFVSFDNEPSFHGHRHYHALCLQLLALDLRSASPVQATSAQRSLVQLFLLPASCAAARHAYESMSSEAQAAIAPFYAMSQCPNSATTTAGKKEARVEATIQAAMAACVDDAESALEGRGDKWANPSLLPFAPWLVSVANELVQSGCSDAILTALADSLRYSAPLCDHLLPLLVFDRIESLDMDKIAAMSDAINRGIRAALTGDIECAAPLIRSVMYAREQMLILRRQPSLTKRCDAKLPLPNGQPPAIPPIVRVAHDTLDVCAEQFLDQIDAFTFARAALKLGRPSTALLLLERWHTRHRDASDSSADYQSLLLDCYLALDDVDGISCASLRLCSSLSSSIDSELVVAESEQRWDRALAIHAQRGDQSGAQRAVKHLQGEALLSNRQDSSEARFEALWRGRQWRESESDALGAAEGFHANIFRALALLAEADSDGNRARITASLQSARASLQALSGTIQHERPMQLVPLSVRLQMLRSIETLAGQPPDARPAVAKQLFDTRHQLSNASFDTMELYDASLAAMFSVVAPALVAPHLCSVASRARQAQRPNAAVSALINAQRALEPENASPWAAARIRVELAQQSQSEGATDRAVYALRIIEKQLAASPAQSFESELLQCEVGFLIGDFSRLALVDSADNIAKRFQRALAMSQQLQHHWQSQNSADSVWQWRVLSPSHHSARLHRSLGDLHDRQFQALWSKYSAPEGKLRRDSATATKAKIDAIERELNTPINNAIIKANRAVDRDTISALMSRTGHLDAVKREHSVEASELEELERHTRQHCISAFQHYEQCLQQAEHRADTLVLYRFCSLLFDHHELLASSIAISTELLASIPSHTFLPLVYQIAARLSSPITSPFEALVSSLVLRLCLDHPHHALPPVFALSHGAEVRRVGHGLHTEFTANQERIEGAKAVLSKVKASDRAGKVCSAMEKLISAYIELGSARFNKEDKAVALANTPLAKLKRELPLLHIPTLRLEPRADCDYSRSLVHIRTFDSQIVFANSGVNRPLIVQLMGSDGVSRKHLVKPADDLRQDAVMQQVFALINERLAIRTDRGEQRMRLRIYIIVPLTPGVGLVEFVSDSVSLHDALVDPGKGSHPRHRASIERATGLATLDYLACLSYLKDAHMSETPDRAVKLRRRFKEICARFPPAFARFLTDLFPAPAAWLRARSMYCASLAVSSIMGYILGIGDRHPHNILIDSSTAELIHIDFGIAFDQGKTLRTPEIVPFRLTRDLVDGLGVLGTEGHFRRACERAMTAMRANAPLLQTVLDVFNQDPLYRWSIDPKKARQLRPGNSDADSSPINGSPDDAGVALRSTLAPAAANSGAARAIAAVRQRLHGDDAALSTGEPLSVAGQVSALIQLATDEDSLAAMYFGWSAFL